MRAGLTEPPLMGPITMISHVTASPITRPANPVGARRSTASAMIVATSRNVPSASATAAWAFVRTAPTTVPPDTLRSLACEPKLALMSRAPTIAPASCTTT